MFYRIGREPVGSKENRFDTKGMDIFRLSGVSIGRNGIFTIGWISRQQFIPAFLINIQRRISHSLANSSITVVWIPAVQKMHRFSIDKLVSSIGIIEVYCFHQLSGKSAHGQNLVSVLFSTGILRTDADGFAL